MKQPLKAGFFIITHSAAETEGLGECAGEVTPLGLAFVLRGDLGAGKTVFTRGLAKGLLAPDAVSVSSPTYVLQHVHRGGLATLYHLDAYRLGGEEEFEHSGLAECLDDPRGVTCIEWGERVAGMLPADRVEVEIEHRGNERRGVHVLAAGERAAKAVEGMIRLAGSRRRLLRYLGPARPPAHPKQSPPSLLS